MNQYPMNFVQAPSVNHQIVVYYKGSPHLQGLSTNKGPVMYPYPKTHLSGPITYPTTHSIPGPYLQSYITCNSRPTYNY